MDLGHRSHRLACDSLPVMAEKKSTKILKSVHASLAVFWALAAVPTVIWLKDSVLWVALMSCYANVYTSAAAWQGARSEQASEED